ncbi:MAG: helix-turn-helix domain-containing protein [Proteobacteria bacterium]|nr:helix-turn-helix domain-containing protein [Pseudomonadota bacterium]
MLLIIAQLLIGFSICYALVVLLTRMVQADYRQSRLAGIMGLVLMLSLIALQVSHFLLLDSGIKFVYSQYYLSLLAVVAPAFYFFSKPVLMADHSFKPVELLHFSPVLLVFFFPYNMSFMFVFLVGMGYLIWLVRVILALVHHRRDFKLELWVLSVVFLIAFMAALLGLSKIWLNDELFFALIATAIGVAFFLIAIALSHSSGFSKQVAEAAKAFYAVSTLSNLNLVEKIKELQLLMDNEKLYHKSNLDLLTVAGKLDMTAHQLSELINTQLGLSFSSFLRVQRVEAAKVMLINEPRSSVLSIGMAVGFASQSNFYDAFSKMTGCTPGKYRKHKD